MKVDMSGARSKIQAICSNQALGSFLASEAARGMDKYVPMRTGQLAASARPSAFKVTYVASYAKYPYNGRNMKFSVDKHPNATSHWDRAYAIADGQKLGDAGTRFLRSLG